MFMSYELMWAVDRSGLPRREREVARRMVSFAKDDGSGIYPSVKRVAEMSGYSERSVQLAQAKLRAMDILREVRSHAPHRPRRYWFNRDALPPAPRRGQLTLFDSRFPQGKHKKVAKIS